MKLVGQRQAHENIHLLYLKPWLFMQLFNHLAAAQC